MKKKLVAGALVLCLLGGTIGYAGSAEAASESWKKDSKGWWYRYSDGSYAMNKWMKSGGAWYYFDEFGYMQTEWKRINGTWYYFGTNGKMQTKWKKIDRAWYYFGTNGKMQTKWKKIGGKWYYFGAYGAMVTGWQEIDGVQYYFGTENGMVTGYKKIDGKHCFFDKDGAYDPSYYDFSNAKVGDIIYFGNYEQDNDTSNGKERIAWKVMEKKGSKLLLLSEKVLDCKKFNETEVYVTWATSDLRAWLNKEFRNTAFLKGEREMIVKSKITTPDNEEWETDCGANTTDQVFVLCAEDAEKYFPTEEYHATKPIPYDYTGSKEGVAKPTKYAAAQGVACAYTDEWYDGCCEYWLRTAGADNTFFTYISDVGTYYSGGNGICNTNVGVRPAIWITQ